MSGKSSRGSFGRLSAVAGAEVGSVLSSLPESLRSLAENVPVVFQMVPSAELLEADEEPEDLLGLFVGEAVNESGGDFPVPPQIFLFLSNIWDFTDGEPRAFRRELRKTFLHELGHYLGLGEGELESRGMS